MKKKKVLLLITKSNFGGAQRYVYDLATNLPADEFEVVVALGGNGPLTTKLTEAGIRTIGLPHLIRDISFTKELRSFHDIYRIIRKERPAVLHVNSSKAGGIGACIGRLLRVPRVVYTAHGWAFNEDRSRLSRFVVGFFHWLTIRLAHTTITVSDALRSQMRWPGTQAKMHTVHLGRQPIPFVSHTDARAQLATKNQTLATHQQDPWLMSIGELHPIKRHSDAINAVASLIETYPQLRYCIIGEGEQRSVLEQHIATLNLSEHVFLLGHIDGAARYLKAADIFVFPSRSEALGYAALEAAQAQLPIVASNVGGIPEIIEDGVMGTLVPPEQPVELAAAIARYLSDPDRAATHAAAAYSHSATFSIAAMVAATTDHYRG